MPDLPSGTVTFLFTDIEGSTALWERDRVAMQAAVARHLRLLRTAIEAHEGVLYKTVGDAVQAAFRTAPAAVAAALDTQRVLLAGDWGDLGELRVRMALHAGEANPDERGDYLTAPLNRLSRLLAIAHGGQIVLTQAVQQLVRGAFPDGAALRDLGEHRLRDLLEPERVFQLLHPDLPAEFSPLRSLENRPHNLPLQPTPFLGRERQLEEIVALMRRSEVRLLTLTGPGGTGKTRLGLQAAAELLDDFTDGVFFVPLAPLTDPQLVPTAIAGALGVREAGERPLVERLREFLATKQVLLVLDNVEHLVEAAPIMGELLGSAPGLKALATSRVPLRLRAEREYPVAPLGLPPRQPPTPPEQLSQYEAAHLFIERAQAVNPGFIVDDENAPAIAEICYRLDGLPLAIELAAARVRMLPPEALLSRLEKRLPLLTGGARDAPARQRTLRDTVAWSYDLLGPEDQILFRRLAVFVGGATLEALERVANADRGLDVFEGLERLLEHNLVRQEQGADGEPRFTMLETIREFGLERLAESGEEADIRAAHAAHFFKVVEEAESKGFSVLTQDAPSDPAFLQTMTRWVARMETEFGNLRATLTFLDEDAGADRQLRLAAALSWLWYTRAYAREGLHWYEKALARLPPSPTRERALALADASSVAHRAGDIRAIVLAEEALEAARQVGDPHVIAQSLFQVALASYWQHDLERAWALHQEALAAWRALGVRYWQGMVLHNLGNVAYLRGDLAAAIAHSMEAMTVSEAVGNWWSVSIALRTLGFVAIDQGAAVDAAHWFRRSLELYRDHGDEAMVGASLLGLVLVMQTQEDLECATRLLGAARATYERVGTLHFPGLPDRLAGVEVSLYERLGTQKFAAAWAAGRLLSVAEAISEAQAVVNELGPTAGSRIEVRQFH
jgi:predicted ATPase/class 3 adenylate cyclase